MSNREDGDPRSVGGAPETAENERAAPKLSPDEPAETLPLGTGALARAQSGAAAKAPGLAPPPASAAPPPKAPPMAKQPKPPVEDDALAPKAPPMAPPASEAKAPAPPPISAPAASGPQAPPMAKSAGPGLPRPPAPSEVLLAPKAPPMAPPPSAPAPLAPPATAPADPLSPAAQTLMSQISGVAPVTSSFEFSQRLPDYLARYWTERRDLLKRDGDGELEQDYEAVLARAKQAHDVEAQLDMDTVLEQVREIADELDGDKVPYFAPGLHGDEKRILQAVHDLSLAMIHYKMAVRVASAADRLVMITSTTGAQGCLEMARNRFSDVPVPEAIHNYARLLELKLRLEEENCRQLLGG